MAHIALFHSVLGVRPGVLDATARLRTAGHQVLVVDQYDGQEFDDYEQAGRFAEQIGYPELMRRATEAVRQLPDGFVAAGFSNGAAMAEHVATQRPVSGVLMLSGAIPLDMLAADRWPPRVPAQIHYTSGDPFRRQEWIDAVTTAICSAGALVEVFDYPGAGHLFTDSSLAGEFQPKQAELLWHRVLAFPPLGENRA